MRKLRLGPESEGAWGRDTVSKSQVFIQNLAPLAPLPFYFPLDLYERVSRVRLGSKQKE